jgi:hypothetical protein
LTTFKTGKLTTFKTIGAMLSLTKLQSAASAVVEKVAGYTVFNIYGHINIWAAGSVTRVRVERDNHDVCDRLKSGFKESSQCSDFLIGIEVWLSARRAVGQQAEWRSFCRGIGRAPVAGEATHDAESRRLLTWLMIGTLSCPLQDQVKGHTRNAFHARDGTNS